MFCYLCYINISRNCFNSIQSLFIHLLSLITLFLSHCADTYQSFITAMGEASGSRFVAQTFPNPVAIRLNEEKLLPWKQQAVFSIRGHKLLKHIQESGGKPTLYLNEEDQDNGKVNEEYTNWEQEDQLLASWLQSSTSESPHTRIVGCESSFEIWKKLEIFLASQASGKDSQLKMQLKSAKKTGSVNEFLLSLLRRL